MTNELTLNDKAPYKHPTGNTDFSTRNIAFFCKQIDEHCLSELEASAHIKKTALCFFYYYSTKNSNNNMLTHGVPRLTCVSFDTGTLVASMV